MQREGTTSATVEGLCIKPGSSDSNAGVMLSRHRGGGELGRSRKSGLQLLIWQLVVS